VLGSGIDVIYPVRTVPSSRGLPSREQSCPSSPWVHHRRRVIFPNGTGSSAASHGVVVIQAGPESGSLITANCALEQGETSLPFRKHRGRGEPWHPSIDQRRRQACGVEQDILEEILPSGERDDSSEGPRGAQTESSEEERKLYDFLEDEPAHIDEIIRETQMDPGRVSSLLLNLELKALSPSGRGSALAGGSEGLLR